MSGTLKPVEEVVGEVIATLIPRVFYHDKLRDGACAELTALILTDRKEACAPLVEALRKLQACFRVNSEPWDAAEAALAQAREDGRA